MNKIAVSTADLRPCTVDKMKALFHRWEDKSWIVPPSPMVGGHLGGVVRGTYAIVEMGDGTVREVEPEKVQFKTDRELFERHCMGKWDVKEPSETPYADAVEKVSGLRIWEIKRTVSKWEKSMKCTCPTCNMTLDTTEEPPRVCPFCGAVMSGYFDAGTCGDLYIYPDSTEDK